MTQDRPQRYDLVVVGGGAAGVAAACAAAATGAQTLLLERYGFLGGAATASNVLSYCGFFVQGPTAIPAIGGVGMAVLARLARLGLDTAPIRAPSGNWIVLLDPEALKLALDQVVEAAGVTCWLHSRVTGASMVDGRIAAIDVTDHAGTRTVEAGCFVDTSGEGNLAACAGHPMTVDASRGSHVQAASFPIRVGGIPPGAEPDRTTLVEIAAVVNRTANRPRVRDGGGTFLRLPFSGEVWWMCIDLETDGLSGASLSAAERAGRALAWQCVQTLKRHTGLKDAYVVSTGPQLGIRETRRPETVAMVTRDDALAGRRSPDGIARAAWPMEVHDVPGRATFIPVGGEGVFDVPLDALRASALGNLWVGGRLIGADAAAYGSVRVMGTGFATGQAAGVAAALEAGGSGISAEAVRTVLMGQGALV